MNGLVSGHDAQGSAQTSRRSGTDTARFVTERPPVAVGQSERRMQVRAYNHWASLLGDRALPPLACLDAAELADFSAHGVVIDLTGADGRPAIHTLGERLAEDLSPVAGGPVTSLTQVPDRSLLSRLTEQYAQVLSNNAPLSFEGEFSNSRDVIVQYRGILLPFSDDDSRVEKIFGVINWREVAGDRLTKALHKEVKAALQSMPAVQADHIPRAVMTDWADGPAAGLSGGFTDDHPALAPTSDSLDAPMPGSAIVNGLSAQSGSILSPLPANVAAQGPEFALVMIRRDSAGQVHVLGEVQHDPALLKQAARGLLPQ